MKVAIMGAGLSGLACAITLESNGIYPTVFEKRNQIGDRFINGEILLSLLTKPVNDPISYFADSYRIFLQPTSHIHNLVLYSEHRKAVIRGLLGFCNLRGRDSQSFENQLASQIKSKIVFNSENTYEQLLQDFTHVVMATGDAAYAVKMQNYRVDYGATLNGYNVSGIFDRYTVRAWLNNRLAPNGYGYLVPISEKEANIAVWHPKYPNRPKLNYHELLDGLFRKVEDDLNQTLKILDHFEINDYLIGQCHYPRIGNTYFTGNCFGSIMPYLGFGQFSSILTGIYAAMDICGTNNYTEMTQGLRQAYQNSLILRKAWEQFDNRRFDRMVQFFDGPLGNKLFHTKHFDVVKFASYLARPWIKSNAEKNNDELN